MSGLFKNTMRNILTLQCPSSHAFKAVTNALPSLWEVANPWNQSNNSSSTPTLAVRPIKFVIPTAVYSTLEKADYPDVCFWTMTAWRDYVKERKSTSSSKKIANHYLETENGDPVSPERLEAFCSQAQSLWIAIFRAHMTPHTWGTAHSDVKKFFLVSMANDFPELCLCSDSWKANNLVTKNYSSFRDNHAQRYDPTYIPTQTVKKEEEDGDLQVDKKPVVNGKKRGREQDETSKKRLKVGDKMHDEIITEHVA